MHDITSIQRTHILFCSAHSSSYRYSKPHHDIDSYSCLHTRWLVSRPCISELGYIFYDLPTALLPTTYQMPHPFRFAELQRSTIFHAAGIVHLSRTPSSTIPCELYRHFAPHPYRWITGFHVVTRGKCLFRAVLKTSAWGQLEEFRQ